MRRASDQAPDQSRDQSRDQSPWQAADRISEPQPDGRYARQRAFQALADSGSKLAQARVAIVGCGALGGAVAQGLTRAGVGTLRLIDRDWVSIENLPHQVLFDEDDVRDQTPKAVAAARRIAAFNSALTVNPIVTDVNPRTISDAVGDVDLIVGGGDNFALHYLLNDFAVAEGRDWIYGDCLGAQGHVLPLARRRDEAPCLRCIFPQPPAPGSVGTCATDGVLLAAVQLVAAYQVSAALQLLTQSTERQPLVGKLIRVDAWTGRQQLIDVAAARDAECACCGAGAYPFLEAPVEGTISLCGAEALQVIPSQPVTLDLERIAASLPSASEARRNRFLLRFRAGAQQVTLFPDGRAIVSGTTDEAVARRVLAEMVGL